LAEIEDIARANRRELQLQFQRIAHMQADLDRLLKQAGAMTPPAGFRHDVPAAFGQTVHPACAELDDTPSRVAARRRSLDPSRHHQP
jgi:hypothetical protein